MPDAWADGRMMAACLQSHGRYGPRHDGKYAPDAMGGMSPDDGKYATHAMDEPRHDAIHRMRWVDDADMMAAMPPNCMEGMSPDMMAAMPPDAMGGMSPEMMANMPPDAMAV